MSGVELVVHRVGDMFWAESTELLGETLNVSEAELLNVVQEDSNFGDVAFHIVRPGDNVRINGVLDVIEPRCKEPDSAHSTFPGIGTDSISAGLGRTHALRGVTVMAVGVLPDGGETFVQEDCLVDMAGPGAVYSPFSRDVQLVVEFPPVEQGDSLDPVAARRLATIRVARFLAARTTTTSSPEVEFLEGGDTKQTNSGVLNAAYVCSLISEGPLHDTLLFGASTVDLEPRWISVPELIDGALVSSDFHFSCQRTPTVLYQRNPVVDAIRNQPGLSLQGVVLTLRYGSDSEKRRAAVRIAEMLVERKIDLIVTHPAVGGNAQVDALNIVEECEKAGIATALILQEMAGDDGSDSGLVDSVPEANLMVSTGNRDQVVELPGVASTLGPTRLRNGTPTLGPLRVSLRSYLCSTGQVGAHTMTASGA